MESYDEVGLLKYFMNVAPVVVVMGIVIWAQYRDNREALTYARTNDIATLQTLKELTHVLETVMTQTAGHKSEIVETVKSSAQSVKEHVDARISAIEAMRTKHGNRRGSEE